jgi:hypothetical protein
MVVRPPGGLNADRTNRQRDARGSAPRRQRSNQAPRRTTRARSCLIRRSGINQFSFGTNQMSLVRIPRPSSFSSGTCHSQTAPTSTPQNIHPANPTQLGCQFGFGRKVRHSPQSAAAMTQVVHALRITERAVALRFTRVRKPARFPASGVSWFTGGRRCISDRRSAARADAEPRSNHEGGHARPRGPLRRLVCGAGPARRRVRCRRWAGRPPRFRRG